MASGWDCTLGRSVGDAAEATSEGDCCVGVGVDAVEDVMVVEESDLPAPRRYRTRRTPRSRGGRTDLKDGVLLCSWHHHRAHDPTYDTRRLPDGGVRFARRT